MNLRRQIIGGLKIEKGVRPPEIKEPIKREHYGSAWDNFLKDVQHGDSTIIPSNWLQGLQSVARAAGWKVPSEKLGRIEWNNRVPLSKIYPRASDNELVGQVRVWFLKS